MAANIQLRLALAIVLASAVGLQLLLALQPVPPTKPPHLGKAIPSSLPGYLVRDEPMGPNEFVNGAVAKALNYDDYVHRSYRRDDLVLGVYVAYWGPGRMSTREIASHTPDRCWTDNGMTCRSARFRVPVVGGERWLARAEWREFTSSALSQPIWVYFWLRAGEKNYDFGQEFNALMNPTEWFRSIWKNTSLTRREHYFVRLTCNRSFEEVRNDPGYREILGHLAALGLAPN